MNNAETSFASASGTAKNMCEAKSGSCGIHNYSEIGKLRRVLLHRIGEEIEGLVPDNFERLLFDDIPYLKVAQEEHDCFANLLRENGVEVIYYVDETEKALADKDVREDFIRHITEESHIYSEGIREAICAYLSEMPTRKMIEKIRNNKIISISLILFVYLLAFISGYVSYKYIPIENILLKFFLCDIIGTIVVYLGGVSLNNASVYDPYWSILPMILVPFFINETIGFNVYTSIIMVFVEIWGLRLTMNWFLRFKNLKIQDWRYTHIQNKHPKLWPLISFFGIHMLPTIVVFMGLLPVFAYVDAFEKKVEINGTYFISCIGCFIAIVIEMLADAQMNTFKKNPENVGKINRNGLWKKSRHPNYFGEILFWFSMFLFNLSVRSDLWILIFCPLIIFLLFISVSIPMLEKRQANNKVGYLEYKKETNALLPIFAPTPQDKK